MRKCKKEEVKEKMSKGRFLLEDFYGKISKEFRREVKSQKDEVTGKRAKEEFLRCQMGNVKRNRSKGRRQIIDVKG